MVTLSLQVKPDSKPYQSPQRCIAYAPQWPFKEELEHLQQQDIIMPIGIDETAEWYNNFALVPKLNRKVRLYLDPARLNPTLKRPVHRGPVLSDIFPKLYNVLYLCLIDVSLGYHNLKLDVKSLYLTTFACQFGRYRYKRLPFGPACAGYMFQRKIDKIF